MRRPKSKTRPNCSLLIVCLLVSSAKGQSVPSEDSSLNDRVFLPGEPGGGGEQPERSIFDIGNCLCDLTFDRCDYNCRCDEDCDSEAMELFTTSLNEGPEPPSLPYCTSDSQMERVNLDGSGLRATVKKRPAKGFLRDELCIEDDNNPALGQFFADPGEGSESDLTSALEEAKPSSFWSPAGLSPLSDGDAYGAGDFILARSSDDESGASQPTRRFTLPTAAFSSACDNAEPLRFLYPFPFDKSNLNFTKCARLADVKSSTCQGSSSIFSAHRIVGDMILASTPQSAPSISIEVESAFYTFVTESSSGTVKELNDWKLDAEWSGKCDWVLKRAELTVVHNGMGAIDSVKARLGFITLESTDAGVLQEIGVANRESGTLGTVLRRSGNPGYLPGYPLLAGKLDSNGDRVKRFNAGLPVITSGRNGDCKNNALTQARFGESLVASCAFHLTKSDLEDFCTGSSSISINGESVSDPIPFDFLGGLLRNDGVQIGRWGGSRSLVPDDWITMEALGSPSISMEWDSESRTCRNVTVGIRYEFLTAFAGAAHNPQRFINFARAEFVYGDWQFPSRAAETTSQRFFLRSEVRFVPQDQGSPSQAKPKEPPIFTPLPEGFFSPIR